MAAPWIPDETLEASVKAGVIDPVFIWSALDCTSAFPMLPAGKGKALVLGQMSVRINCDVKVGERCVMLGWPISQEGKKHFSASAVIGESGSVAAVARATWMQRTFSLNQIIFDKAFCHFDNAMSGKYE